MKFIVKAVLILLFCFSSNCSSVNSDGESGNEPKFEPVQVQKTNPMQIYMHYMPWYHSREVTGYWGSHWRMGNKNPDNMDETGRREIAAHYYPLIGPYDSRDDAVIEYHLLLMKYAGVDAVLIDWYGTHNVYDYRPNLLNSDAFINRVGDAGLQYAIVYEEFTAENVGNQTGKTPVEAAQEDMEYMNSHYFSADEYLYIDDAPLLMTFGPRYFRQAGQWDEIFSSIDVTPNFLPLWHHAHYVGGHGDGEFSWVDFNESLSSLSTFYNRNLDLLIGSAYPRFHDFYEEGGWGQSYGRVYSNHGETLRSTLRLAQDNDVEYLQLVTWNDFGEGTVFEPTLEDEFLFLEIVQDFTGVPYSREELELIHLYYLKKKELNGNSENQEILERVFGHFVALEVDEARALLNQLN